MIKMLNKIFLFFVSLFKEIVARNTSYSINLTHPNLLSASLAELVLCKKDYAIFVNIFRLGNFLSKLKITHSKVHFCQKIAE